MDRELVPVPPFDGTGLSTAEQERALEAHAARLRAYHAAQAPARSAPTDALRPLQSYLVGLKVGGGAATLPSALPSPPACGQCHDYGFLSTPNGMVPCACRALPLPGTPPRYQTATFARFNTQRPLTRSVRWNGASITPDEQRRVLHHARATALAWSAAPSGVLFVYGPVGSGKTHLATAVGSAIRHAGGTGRYVACATLLDEDVATLWRTPLLLLDDLGTEEDTPAHRERWLTILARRYDAALPTVITANRADFVLPQRLEDRLHETSTIIVLAVESMRVHLRAQGGV